MTLSESWVDFVAGWSSGAMAVLLCQPMDTVLTRLQAGGNHTIGTTTTTTTTNPIPPPPPTSNNAQQITRKLISKFGVSSLWRGSSPMISAVPFQNSLLMGGYGLGKQWAELNNTNAKEHDHLLPIFIGGCTGGIVQSFLMSPVEWIKVQTQVVGLNHARQTLLQSQPQLLSQSTSVLTRGLTATLLRDGIPHGVWFVSYEWCKNTLDSINDMGKNEAASSASSKAHQQLTIPLVSGAFAATLAWAVGYPFDIVKTRIQASSTHQPALTVYQTAQQLIHEAHGNVWLGLYRGFGLKLVRAVPASMIGFTTYEWVANQLRNG